jgi:hypothetical protein
MKLSDSITEAYVASGAGIPTDTLLTKILLGTVGCVPLMIDISKRLLLIPAQHPKYSARSRSGPSETCTLLMRMNSKSSESIAAAELSIQQLRFWICAFSSTASREIRKAKKRANNVFDLLGES